MSKKFLKPKKLYRYDPQSLGCDSTEPYWDEHYAVTTSGCDLLVTSGDILCYLGTIEAVFSNIAFKALQESSDGFFRSGDSTLYKDDNVFLGKEHVFVFTSLDIENAPEKYLIEL